MPDAPVAVPAPSPTGTPVVKPSVVPTLVLVLLALNGALGALQLAPGVPHWLSALALVVVPLIGSLLGVLSPGARKSDGVA